MKAMSAMTFFVSSSSLLVQKQNPSLILSSRNRSLREERSHSMVFLCTVVDSPCQSFRTGFWEFILRLPRIEVLTWWRFSMSGLSRLRTVYVKDCPRYGMSMLRIFLCVDCPCRGLSMSRTVHVGDCPCRGLWPCRGLSMSRTMSRTLHVEDCPCSGFFHVEHSKNKRPIWGMLCLFWVWNPKQG